MKKEFVPYKIALDMKELGFDELCFGFYDESLYFPNNENQYGTFCNQPLDAPSCSAPLYQQAFRWLYQKLGIEKGVMPLDTESQQLLLKELIDKVSSKHSLV